MAICNKLDCLALPKHIDPTVVSCLHLFKGSLILVRWSGKHCSQNGFLGCSKTECSGVSWHFAPQAVQPRSGCSDGRWLPQQVEWSWSWWPEERSGTIPEGLSTFWHGPIVLARCARLDGPMTSSLRPLQNHANGHSWPEPMNASY